MKKLLIGLVLLGSLSSFAGVLENRATGESLEFTIDTENHALDIISTASQIKSGKYQLVKITKKESRIDLLEGNRWAEGVYSDDFIDGYESSVGDVILTTIIPLFNLPRILGTTFDVLALPIKAPLKLFSTMRNNKDFVKLQKAINSTATIRVSNKRFRRIENILKKDQTEE